MSTGDDERDERKAIGGYARAQALAPEARKDIARRAALARWDGPRATHSGTLKIGGAELPAYVLETGERIISTRGVMKALKRTWRGRKYSGTEMPVFLEARNLKPFISEDLVMVLCPLKFRTEKGLAAEGFRAEVLPAICEIYLRARDDNALTPPQFALAKQCEILTRGLSRVGIIALVDEATGYQDFRARDALAKILEAFVAKELRPWVKTFQPDFYKEMFRLRGIPYTDSPQRPRYIGHLTNDLVYQRLAPGVLAKLRERNPTGEKGRRRHRHTQWLTDEVGDPKLREHLSAVTALMKAEDDWDVFKRKIDRVFPAFGRTIPLPLPEVNRG